MKGLVIGICTMVVICAFTSGLAWGQATAQISGTARDASGAVLPGVEITATQTDIAQLAGSSRESASRFLASLEREGVVTCGRGKVVVHDPAALRGFLR